MNKVAAFALRRKNSILSMSEKLFCPPQPLRFWITPACAGKRRSDWIIRSIYWDHPRVCGEKALKSWLMSGDVGSPPRVRGKAKGTDIFELAQGITPACAGKSGGLPCRVHRCGDHPRVCGEKWPPSKAHRLGGGSPPRVRGKDCTPYYFACFVRITPACAGKSKTSAVGCPGCRDHPRVCGEKTKPVPAGGILMGSPPRMRGKAVHHKHRHSPGRITPACAGKSSCLPLLVDTP